MKRFLSNTASRVPFATLAVILIMTACDLRPLYEEGVTPVEVLVRTDWTQLGSDPQGSTIVFYPEDGSRAWTFKTNSVTRTIVTVPSGYYTVQVFNRTVDEFGTMSFDGMDHLSSARAILESKLFSWVGRADTVGRTVYEPEEIVVGRTDHFKVRTQSERESYRKDTNPAANYDSTLDSVMVTPKRVRYSGTVSLRINGIQNIRSVRAYLTGMAGSVYMATRSAGDTLATHVIETWKLEKDEADYTKGWVRGTFYCFGLPEQYQMKKGEKNNKLLVQFMLVDNKTVIQEIRYVGDLVSQNDKELTDEIAIEKAIKLPDVKPEGGSESGFDVSFSDWETPIDVPIGI